MAGMVRRVVLQAWRDVKSMKRLTVGCGGPPACTGIPALSMLRQEDDRF